MKNKYFVLLIVLYFGNLFSQLDINNLTKSLEMRKIDFLNIYLENLSARISSKSYYIGDMGYVEIPVAINLNDSLFIEFNLHGKINKNYSEAEIKSTIERYMNIVVISLSELMNNQFPDINFKMERDIVGYWCPEHSFMYSAHWGNGKFIWAENVKKGFKTYK